MNDLDFPDEPDYVPMVDLHLGVPEVKPIQIVKQVEEQKNYIIIFLDILVVLLGIGNIWLFISVCKWMLE